MEERNVPNVGDMLVGEIQKYLRDPSGRATTETITLVKATVQCPEAANSWHAWDDQGLYYYLRFRWGRGTIATGYGVDDIIDTFADDGAPDITIEDFCLYMGVLWAPEMYAPKMTLAAIPPWD